jgi:hypothetical protein
MRQACTWCMMRPSRGSTTEQVDARYFWRAAVEVVKEAQRHGDRKALRLPAHPLLVHAVVVLVPLCSLGVAVGALWPAARWRLAWVLLGLTIVTVAMVPLATGSGEVLEEMVKENGLVERHAELGDGYLPYAFALLIGAFAVAGLQWIEGGRHGRSALVPVREVGLRLHEFLSGDPATLFTSFSELIGLYSP